MSILLLCKKNVIAIFDVRFWNFGRNKFLVENVRKQYKMYKCKI